MEDTVKITAEELKGYIERIEKLEQEKRDVQDRSTPSHSGTIHFILYLNSSFRTTSISTKTIFFFRRKLYCNYGQNNHKKIWWDFAN